MIEKIDVVDEIGGVGIRRSEVLPGRYVLQWGWSRIRLSKGPAALSWSWKVIFKLNSSIIHIILIFDLVLGFKLNYYLKIRQGVAEACINEGVMHFQGIGIPVDYSKAFAAYQKAFLIDSVHFQVEIILE